MSILRHENTLQDHERRIKALEKLVKDKTESPKPAKKKPGPKPKQ